MPTFYFFIGLATGCIACGAFHFAILVVGRRDSRVLSAHRADQVISDALAEVRDVR